MPLISEKQPEKKKLNKKKKIVTFLQQKFAKNNMFRFDSIHSLTAFSQTEIKSTEKNERPEEEVKCKNKTIENCLKHFQLKRYEKR